MIPAFPEFKPITVGDRDDVEKHTHKFEPYSDFNFSSLFSWDTDKKRQISELNNNLVVLITEYITEEPLLSFLGTNKTTETALELIKYAKENGISTTLRYVPEVSTENIDESKLIVKEDRDDFDYLFSISGLNGLEGRKFKNKRQLYKWFKNDNPKVEFLQKDITDPSNKEDIAAVLKYWENNKHSDEKEYDLEHEKIAVDRLLTTPDKHILTVSSLIIDGKISAFSIDELLPDGFVTSHFCKANYSYRGIYDFLNVQITKSFMNKGAVLWNWEQDLGIDGLRNGKIYSRPVRFLKKYRVDLKE